jgi:hypothetical protein
MCVDVQWQFLFSNHNGNFVRDDLKLPDDGGEISKSRKRLAVMKSPLYLKENLSGGQLPLVLWR